MAELDVANVMRIAREVAFEQFLPLKVVGVVFGGGGDYVEILINIDGCAIQPCQFAIGTFRNGTEADLRTELATRLSRHLDDYRALHSRRARAINTIEQTPGARTA